MAADFFDRAPADDRPGATPRACIGNFPGSPSLKLAVSLGHGFFCVAVDSYIGMTFVKGGDRLEQ
ncbi:hypothetical protein GGD63_003863 [Bradyrhizobium sp. cir1]|uniref:hypothetical protein n=1 Tax=Bradyrhizobium sp. cir1 TaxID=1445730 RepID=UPI00160561AF|nr:hypothetical protein [Bradyrhizobium sp. cir1]MBB4371066.1 hypothetical protein [Bradyrhizobium sp. cir1]